MNKVYKDMILTVTFTFGYSVTRVGILGFNLSNILYEIKLT